MRVLTIDFDEIQRAMEDVSRDSFDYYLDTESGKVVVVSENIMKEVQSMLLDESDYDEIPEDVEYIEFEKEPEIPEWMLDELEVYFEVILDDKGRFARIPERDRNVAYKTMYEFMEKVNNDELKEKLKIALSGKGAFRRFKDVLIEYPKERKRWHGFNAIRMRKEITEWLETLGIKPS
jgi:hypothetical protein